MYHQAIRLQTELLNETYLRRENMSSEVSQSELEASILAIDDDFDSYQGVCGNRPRDSRAGLWR